LVVFGLTNGMVGSLALTLPLYAFNAGYIASLIVILLTGFFSYFSCYLYIKHLAGEDETGSAFQ
jgi:amino acid permease